MTQRNLNIAFIVGCQRSGTTILSDILNAHPEIACWNEPYFIWDWHLGVADTDQRGEKDATPEVKDFTDKAFRRFQKKSRCQLMIEKSPENCFRLPFVHALCPEAKYIHIVRDGRDVVLSMNKEWNKRAEQVKNPSFIKLWHWSATAWREQPYFRNAIQQIWFEFKNMESLNPGKFFNKSRWKGYPGWGPRFAGWQESIENLDTLEFNALQWAKAEEQFAQDKQILHPDQLLEVSYEEFLQQPVPTLKRILGFLECDPSEAITLTRPLNRKNFGKWQKVFSEQDIRKIEAIAGPTLQKLGYKRALDHAA